MDIQRAKEEIKTAVRAYLACDDTGAPLIPASVNVIPSFFKLIAS